MTNILIAPGAFLRNVSLYFLYAKNIGWNDNYTME